MAFSKKTTSFGKKSFGPSRRASSSGYGADKPVERHKATCNACHKVCEVPFRPNGKKPVYCRECFRANEPAPVSSSYTRPAESRNENASNGVQKELQLISAKLDRLILVVEEQKQK